MNSSETETEDYSLHRYLVMWDMLGLETLIDITAKEQENIMSVLMDQPVKHTNPIQLMILRARFNQQRHYEIYLFDSDMDEVSIRELFETDPQTVVNSIRQVGHQLYSDRANTDKVRIV